MKHLERGSPEVQRTFAALKQVLERLGPFDLIPVKTMIVLAHGGNFGGIVIRKSALDVGFFLARQLSDPRVRRAERLSPRKFVHHVQLASVAEIDDELVGWLQEAYEGSAPFEGKLRPGSR
jgi:hypothetical protein